jgi:mycothiol synthase
VHSSTVPRLRALTTDDIAAWCRLLAGIERADRTGEHYDETDLAEELANPDIDPERDVVGAFLGRELVGFFTSYPRVGEGSVKVHLDGGVAPSHRGRSVGGLLARAMRTRVDEVHDEVARRQGAVPRTLVTISGVSDNAAQADLLAQVGLRPERWSFLMRATLGPDLPPAGELPTGLELQAYEDGLDGAMLAAHNAAFVDHPNFAPWTDTMWRQWVSGSHTFRPDVSFVVLDTSRPGHVAAYLQTSEYDAHRQATGQREAYVGKVGTRREYRGRGLAGMLLRRALLAYRDAGYDTASLDVDSENPTGALGLYRRAGFEVVRRWTDYTLRLG